MPHRQAALPQERPADQGGLRRHNLALVLRDVRVNGPHARARIAEETGLTKASVSSLVTELTDRGLLREAGLDRGGVGRPGQVVELDGRAVCGIGAEINVHHLGVLALDLRGQEVTRRRRSVDCSALEPAAVLDLLAALVAETVAEVRAAGAEPVGLAVGVAGLVDVDAGSLRFGPNLRWLDVPVAAMLHERLGEPGFPVHVENEANLATMAEAAVVERGAEDDVLVVSGEVGVGGGVVSAGRLLRGHRGFAGEIGHITVDPHGRTCGCGRVGCWETVVGLRALLTAVADPDDALSDPAMGLEDRLAEIDRRAELGDARTLAALDELGRWLGVGLSTLANVLNPRAVVLGGYFATLGRWLVEPVRRRLAEGAVIADVGACEVLLSSLGFGAAVRGGAELALEAVFADPTLVARQTATAQTAGATR